MRSFKTLLKTASQTAVAANSATLAIIKGWAASLPARLFNHCLICGQLEPINLNWRDSKNHQNHQSYQHIPSLCHACQALLPHSHHYCQHCGKRLQSPNNSVSLCGRCLSKTAGARRLPPVDRLCFPYWYQPPISELIRLLKFGNQLVYADLLGELFARYLTALAQEKPNLSLLPQLIIPVPLHLDRLQQRGYNQTLELARTISRRLEIPLDHRHLIRTVNTIPQTLTSASTRQRNPKNTFAAPQPLPAQFQRVALLDDVFTTGATATACARALKQAGAKEVQVWCIARTLFH